MAEEMTDDLQALEMYAIELLTRFSPSQRRAALMGVARVMRRNQSDRIAQQLNPDGTPYEPRKRASARSRKGRIRRQAMFQKLRTARWLKVEASPDEAAVGFAGRIARIAAVHQFGARAPVAPHGPEYQYPRRALVGVAARDRDSIRAQLIAHLDGRVSRG
ncbi:phage virion morphogenesis protein [Burkholderia aenigmatica]|uniref:phage virion morphogenesis protein n=1 Tax=Burkholderia aenigmatica TaxID=2015348 RepID=UPI001F02F07A|nr:phage virion morphogenesis protein [Burkholderia aenigmatica]UKD15460.1 phage virion morphogenesis protein [Burkholderia aenigmatica]